ncbi:MAG: hypothetical protein QOH71_2328 [Blastocatellia bacterium]|nr:hypothetical protein [Blastocatellia bacterium]
MRRTTIFTELVVIVLLSIHCRDASGQTATPTPPPPVPRHDTQQWNDVQLIVPMTNKVDFILLGTLRLGRNLFRPVDERIGISFSYSPTKSITLLPSYLHIERQPSAGRGLSEDRAAFTATLKANKYVSLAPGFLYINRSFAVGQSDLERRPSVAVTFTLPRPRFTLSDRNLVERRLRQPQGNSTRYRNLLQLQYPFVFRGRHLILLVSDEVSYESALKAWVRNRFLAGIRKQINNYCSADFYYTRQNDGRARALPGDFHVIGLSLAFRLGGKITARDKQRQLDLLDDDDDDR